MSSTQSQHSQNPNPKNITVVRHSEIKHFTNLSENLSALFTSHNANHAYSDVVLVVAGQKLHVHKVILAMRSEYFQSLFYGGLKESKQSEIELPDVPLRAFKILLEYIYTGRMYLGTLGVEVILETLTLAQMYGLELLEVAISDALKQMLTVHNVCTLLNGAHQYGLDRVVEHCNEFLDQHAVEMLVHESFLELSQDSVVQLLTRDSFFAPEMDVLHGMLHWCNVNKDMGDTFKGCVRLSLISTDNLLNVVLPTGLVNHSDLLSAIANSSLNINRLPNRGVLLLNEDVAATKMGTKILVGKTPPIQRDSYGRSITTHPNTTYYHTITGPTDKGIIFELAKPYIINHIRMLLHVEEERRYSYFIEVSMNQEDWVRVIDYSQYLCRSWQYLYFDRRVIQYIRIVGVKCSKNDGHFNLVSLEAMCKSKTPSIIDDIICPLYNVALDNAMVIEGSCKEVLLNGVTENYTLDSGYTSHTIGSNPILIQLNQPYVISTMRLLLLDCDARAYSYYIESSMNNEDWEIVVDNREEECKSWQVVQFPPRSAIYIRIVGTYSSATETFQCVHFECSSCADDESSTAPPVTANSIKQPKGTRTGL